MMKPLVPPSRRFNSRIETRDGVWVYWRCNGRDDTSRVRDVSLGGLFIETQKTRQVGTTAVVDFLVQEGQIRAEAVVRHVEPGSGLGLKFTAVNVGDRSKLVGLMNRLRSVPRQEPKAL